MMCEGISYAEPWSSPNNTSMLSKVKGNMIGSVEQSCSDNHQYNDIMGSHIDEDFLIEDLSEFSNEDLGAPIITKHPLLGFSPPAFPQFSSDADNTSISIQDLKNFACDTPNTSSDGFPILPDSDTMNHRDSQPTSNIKDPLMPCQDETGFDWLSSFGDDGLIYGASNFSVDSFLLSSAEPFNGGYDGLLKHGDGDENNAKSMKLEHIHGASMDDDDGAGNAGWGNSKMMFAPHGNGRARSKRARSAGWSSSSILCSWSNHSPSDSLDSTSKLSQIVPSPNINSCAFTSKQEVTGIGRIYSSSHMKYPSSSPDKLCSDDKSKTGINLSKLSEFTPNVQAFHCWTKEEDNREESTSNQSGLGQPRRCTHCLSQKTPQWRAGPEGPKTLCNACGVRYKSGRLFDEYRPAKSPTFVSYKHSNSHKKVMEMRRRKSFHYQTQHHHQQHHYHAVHSCGMTPPLKQNTGDRQVVNKLKAKLNPTTLEPHSHFSDVTLISSQSTRAALDSPASFLY